MIDWATLQANLYACRACDRCKTRQIDAPFFGLGNLNASVIFIGESPGFQTRQVNGITFCGNRSGDYLLEICAQFNIHAGNAYFTNVVKCQKKDNETPSDIEIEKCENFLREEIFLVKPKLIVCVGATALSWMLPGYTLNQMLYTIEKIKYLDEREVLVTAIPHPSYILRMGMASHSKNEKHGAFKDTSAPQETYNAMFVWLKGIIKELK